MAVDKARERDRIEKEEGLEDVYSLTLQLSNWLLQCALNENFGHSEC